MKLQVTNALPWPPALRHAVSRPVPLIRVRSTVRGGQNNSRSPEEDTEEDESCCVIEAPPKNLNLIDLLLNRSSSRVQRGTCSCRQCRGAGTVTCPACEGAGLLKPVKHAVPAANEGGLQSNRCRRCHGLGKLICEECKGSGMRYRGVDAPCTLPQ